MHILPKEGRFIAGVCHAREKLDCIAAANIRWNREDVPFPFQPGKFGELTPAYIAYRDKVRRCAARGLNTMCVTPYPKAFAQFGVDPASAEGLAVVEETLRWMAADLKAAGLRGYQITNELNVFHFRVPLTMEQVPAFLIAGIRGVHAGDPDAILGYNSAGVGPEVQAMIEQVRPYHDLVDYMGVDSYRGTWSDGEPDDILGEIDATYNAVGLPVLVQEFGFSSAGEIYTPEEALAYVRSTGFDSLEAVYENPEAFLERIPTPWPSACWRARARSGRRTRSATCRTCCASGRAAARSTATRPRGRPPSWTRRWARSWRIRTCAARSSTAGATRTSASIAAIRTAPARPPGASPRRTKNPSPPTTRCRSISQPCKCIGTALRKPFRRAVLVRRKTGDAIL